MKEIQKIQMDAMNRIGTAMSELEFLTDPFEIEAKLYLIESLSRQAFFRAFEENTRSMGMRP